MSLSNQSQKAKKLSPTVSLHNGIGHKHITSCRSDTDASVNYQQVIQPIRKETIDGREAIVYRVTCYKIGAPDLCACPGNSHARQICKHSLAGLRLVVKLSGKKLYTASKLSNALKRKGVLIKIIGDGGFCYGMVG